MVGIPKPQHTAVPPRVQDPQPTTAIRMEGMDDLEAEPATRLNGQCSLGLIPLCGYQRTIQPNGLPALLHRAGGRPTASIRGLARLLPRPAPLGRGRPPLRLFARRVSRAVPCLPARAPARLLRRAAPRAGHATKE